MKTGKVERWCVGSDPRYGDGYTAPEMMPPCLCGLVYDREGFEQGSPLITSPIVGKTAGDEIVTASGSVYLLGEIDPVYEEKYPNAKARLLESLKVMEVS